MNLIDQCQFVAFMAVVSDQSHHFNIWHVWALVSKIGNKLCVIWVSVVCCWLNQTNKNIFFLFHFHCKHWKSDLSVLSEKLFSYEPKNFALHSSWFISLTHLKYSESTSSVSIYLIICLIRFDVQTVSFRQISFLHSVIFGFKPQTSILYWIFGIQIPEIFYETWNSYRRSLNLDSGSKP